MAAGLDRIIARSLGSFASFLRTSGWRGREREAVSLYAFGHLVPLCRPGTILHDPAQIGIEVSVPQLGLAGQKAQVCKDLVLWPAPAMTCWDGERQPTIAPMAVLEWKTNRDTVRRRDVDWLRRFTGRWPTAVGYAITLDLGHRRFLVSCARVASGAVDSGCLVL